MPTQEVQIAARDQLTTACANRGKPAIPVGKIVANLLGQPAVVEAISKWLTGAESPSGNPQFDRLRVVDVVRREATRIHMPLPDQPVVKDATIARQLHRQMKQLKLPVTRSGRWMVELPQPAATTETITA